MKISLSRTPIKALFLKKKRQPESLTDLFHEINNNIECMFDKSKKQKTSHKTINTNNKKCSNNSKINIIDLNLKNGVLSISQYLKNIIDDKTKKLDLLTKRMIKDLKKGDESKQKEAKYNNERKGGLLCKKRISIVSIYDINKDNSKKEKKKDKNNSEIKYDTITNTNIYNKITSKPNIINETLEINKMDVEDFNSIYFQLNNKNMDTNNNSGEVEVNRVDMLGFKRIVREKQMQMWSF
jgi:hypothetical protein